MSAHLAIDCTAGSHIINVARDAQRIADMLGIGVDFKFNGVKCVASPGGDAEWLAINQQAEQGKKQSHPNMIRFAVSTRKPTV